jgi:hypothetical protein
LKLDYDEMLSKFCFEIQLALLHLGGGTGSGLGRAVQVDPIKTHVESAWS